MTDSLPTIWEVERHTLAKHAILRGYLQAWMPILSHQLKGNSRALFVDGFAGPGTYAGGEPGSPVLALKTALEQEEQFSAPIHLLFIESHDERFASLKRQLSTFRPELHGARNVVLLEPEHGECEPVLKKLLDDYDEQRRRFGPALVFLDQFGYSAVSMELISRILKHDMCEVFSYLQWRDMNRFITDPSKWAAISHAFGGDDWKPALQMSGKEREDFLLNAYREQLLKRAGAKYVWHFAMCGDGDELLYWLFFATNSEKGLREMKRAMLRVDDTGQFRFSDATNPNQMLLLKVEGASDEWLASHLSRKFMGTTLTVREIDDYVLRQTPCHKFADALADLESAGLVRAVDPPRGRRKGSFKNFPDMRLEFQVPKPTGKDPEQGTLF